jgi:imidazolonepropionase-like amidohydrolase
MLRTFYLTIFILLLSGSLVYSQTSDRYYLLKAGQFYDSEKNAFLGSQEVLIKNNRVVSVGTKLTLPPNTAIIDFGDATIAPGLIDAHSHILLEQQIDQPLAVDAMMISPEARVLRAAKFAKSYLESGFTTIRDLGNSGQYLDVEVRRAIENGYIPGPRMLVSGPIIGSMDGQVDGIPLADFDRVSRQEYSMISGVDGIEHAYGFKKETLDKMSARGIYVVPTFGSKEIIRKYYEIGGQPYTEADLEDNAATWKKWTRDLKAAGLTIVAGSDSYIDLKLSRGDNAKHTIWGYADAGLSPEDVLQTATRNAAIALGMKDQIGVIKENRFADIVVFAEDMKTDFKKSLFEVKMMMKDGEIQTIK